MTPGGTTSGSIRKAPMTYLPGGFQTYQGLLERSVRHKWILPDDPLLILHGVDPASLAMERKSSIRNLLRPTYKLFPIKPIK